jgi:hypothetical protein
MTIGLGFLAMILALYALGAWLGHQDKTEHPPRHEGWYRTPCSDVTNFQRTRVRSSRPFEFCN